MKLKPGIPASSKLKKFNMGTDSSVRRNSLINFLLFYRQETRGFRSDESTLYRLKQGSEDGLLDQDFHLVQSKTGNQSGMDIRT